MVGDHTLLVKKIQKNLKPQMPPNGQKHILYIVENYFFAQPGGGGGGYGHRPYFWKFYF